MYVCGSSGMDSGCPIFSSHSVIISASFMRLIPLRYSLSTNFSSAFHKLVYVWSTAICQLSKPGFPFYRTGSSYIKHLERTKRINIQSIRWNECTFWSNAMFQRNKQELRIENMRESESAMEVERIWILTFTNLSTYPSALRRIKWLWIRVWKAMHVKNGLDNDRFTLLRNCSSSRGTNADSWRGKKCRIWRDRHVHCVSIKPKRKNVCQEEIASYALKTQFGRGFGTN